MKNRETEFIKLQATKQATAILHNKKHIYNDLKDTYITKRAYFDEAEQILLQLIGATSEGSTPLNWMIWDVLLDQQPNEVRT